MRVFIMKRVTLFKIAACAIIIISAAVYTYCAFIGSDTPAFSDSGLCITRVQKADSAVALTFDTAFGKDQTTELLKILKDKGAKATFAVLGAWAEENPDIVDEIVSQGHEIISHSMMHERYNELGKEKALQDAIAAKEMLKLDFGIETNMIRTPYGAGDDEVYTALAEAGYVPIGWSVDAQDWRNDGADNIATRVLDNVNNGSIIVMQNNNIQTVEALPKIIDGLYDMNYECVTLTELGANG